ncbi:MAG: 3-isopropylmalate dehydratase small subunit [Candidatus Diapherotrites archaeon]|nr:3-isopropylmalate dehydratase small subunit [Candidatus Diapherotrites archaeon]
MKITEIKGHAIVLPGNDIDTDRIIPARYLKEITFTNMGNYVFFDERFDEQKNKKEHSFNVPKFKGANILIVQKNFGCGSSREHAVHALQKFGIQCIIGESFAGIFETNCLNLGIPIVTAGQAEIETLMKFIEKFPETKLKISLIEKNIQFTGNQISLKINESSQKAFLTGTWNSTQIMKENQKEIQKTVQKIPYLNGFIQKV